MKRLTKFQKFIKFWTSKNGFRLIGFILLLVGAALPLDNLKIYSFEIPGANLMSICGAILLVGPNLINILKKKPGA